jgi:hypothetical protein
MENAISLRAPLEGDRVIAQDGGLGRVDSILRSESGAPLVT